MTLRIAFYGAGEPARPYLDVLARRADVQVCAVCDLDQRAAEQVAAGWGADVLLSYEAMLQDVRPDALWVCVPPYLQGDVLLRAAELRVPFFVEPPGAMSFERAVQYEKAVRDAGLVTAVGFPTAATDVVREAREYIGTNVVPLALGWWLRPARGDLATPSALALLWNEAGGLIDALRYFCGAVKQVHAFAAGPQAEQAGGLIVQLAFERGTVAVLTLATYPRPEPRVELELLGEGWTLSFESGLTRLKVSEHDKTTILRSLTVAAEEQCQTFLDAVTRGDPGGVACSYLDAMQTLRVCHAAAVSAREGRTFALDGAGGGG